MGCSSKNELPGLERTVSPRVTLSFQGSVSRSLMPKALAKERPAWDGMLEAFGRWMAQVNAARGPGRSRPVREMGAQDVSVRQRYGRKR